ncbi:LigA protein OS=Streptomyces alboniger OX=132473 GN=CP975_31495 PE=4 SV=1 [Streptomyces alboniger]
MVAGSGETWLIGSRDGAQVLLRWDGRGWRDLPVPPGSVYGLHIVAADDVWAAGDTGSGAAVSHFDGKAWQQTIVSGFPRSGLGSVLAVSPTEVWAGGTAGFIGGPAGKPIPPLLVRFDGQSWSRVSVPADFGSITSLAPGASGELGWVSVARSLKWGPPGSTPPLVPGPDFLAWDGRTFTEYSEPAVPGEGDSATLQLAPVPGTDTVWSVGRAGGPEATFAPRILRFG